MYTIDLNDQTQLTKENVARLIGSENDDRNWQLRVRLNGVAYLSDIVGNLELDGLAFRLETWIQGNSYVGVPASEDDTWVETVYQLLKENWPKPKAALVDW